MHISVTSIEYVEEKKSFDVSFKLFWDDFEAIIARNYGVVLNLGKDGEEENKDFYFTRYIKDSFSFRVDGLELNPEYHKDTINEASIWLYYTYAGNEGDDRIEVENRLMLDMFADQTNLLLIKVHDIEKGFTMKQKKDLIAIDISND